VHRASVILTHEARSTKHEARKRYKILRTIWNTFLYFFFLLQTARLPALPHLKIVLFVKKIKAYGAPMAMVALIVAMKNLTNLPFALAQSPMVAIAEKVNAGMVSNVLS